MDGAAGPSGPQGPSGENGLDGAAGPSGPQGPSGENGLDGTAGPSGPQGPSGENGLDGAAGPSGPQGPSGENGLDGATGPSGPAGANGASGPSGPQGPSGDDGDDGEDGATAYVDVQPIDLNMVNHPCENGGYWITWGHGTDEEGSEPICNAEGGSGALIRTNTLDAGDQNCAHGGVELLVGFDTSGEGVLDDNEVDPALTKYVCNGAPGATGPQGLQGVQGMNGQNGQQGADGADGADGDDGSDGADGSNAASRVIMLDAGSDQCDTGGVLVETGVDENGDGELNDDEVDASQKICNGQNGNGQAFAFEPIGKNKECGANTGVRVLSGLDDGEGNGTPNNNVLESDEVDARRALCVTGADLSVKDDGGCSVTNGAGAKSNNGFLAIVGLVFGIVSVIARRRRKRS
jgi:hypothetical protein